MEAGSLHFGDGYCMSTVGLNGDDQLDHKGLGTYKGCRGLLYPDFSRLASMPRQTTFEDQAVELPRLQVMVRPLLSYPNTRSSSSLSAWYSSSLPSTRRASRPHCPP